MGNESDLQQKHCTPCEGGVSPLSDDEEARLHAHIPDWEIERNGTHRLKRSFRFDSFGTMTAFLQRVAKVVDRENHHPDITISGTKADFELTTHKIQGLSENDFILASKIDACTAAP